MSDPATAQRYERRFKRSMRIEGLGLDVVTVAPCPFCAAPDWARWPVLDIYTPMQEDRTCRECGRSARHVVTRDGHGSTTVTLVQTGGEDPPAYLAPWPERVEP